MTAAAKSTMERRLIPPVGARHPRVWLLVGDKLGDNAQLDAIMGALGWRFERKHLRFQARYEKRRPFYRATLSHVDRARSEEIAPPWPDLILTSGRRPSMVGLWIRRQSGGRSKLVIVGRPHRMLQEFDLVITSALFHLPQQPNILKLALPAMQHDPARVAAEAAAWRPRLAHLPRPLTVLLVGGPEDPFRFDRATARQLLEQARALPPGGGTLIVVTSRRTPPDIVATLSDSLPAKARLFCWTADRHDNPYVALLGLGDRFIVTGDSISMMVEVARLRKPLAIAALPRRRAPWSMLEQAAGRRFRSGKLLWGGLRRFLHGNGLAPFARDIGAFHSMMFERGLAVPLGRPFLSQPGVAPDGLALVAERVRALLGQPGEKE